MSRLVLHIIGKINCIYYYFNTIIIAFKKLFKPELGKFILRLIKQ